MLNSLDFSILRCGVCVRVRALVLICVCVCEREREREREREKEGEIVDSFKLFLNCTFQSNE